MLQPSRPCTPFKQDRSPSLPLVTHVTSTRQTGYARFVQDLRENAITEGADVEAAVAKARTEWRELPTDTKEVTRRPRVCVCANGSFNKSRESS